MNGTEQLLNSIIGAFSKSDKEIKPELISNLLKSNADIDSNIASLETSEIMKIADEMSKTKKFNFQSEISWRTLSRWYEIPEEEFKDTRKEQLEDEVLIKHIILESKFKKWLEEWDYEVTIGDDLEGVENIELIPDIYAKRVTLHGTFEIVICFVCDNPPNTYRVRAFFETFESFARADSEFSSTDILLVVTPNTFGKGIIQSITLQNQEELYTVVGLEGNDISILDSISDPMKRLLELKEHIEKAQLKAKKKY